jgi:hypothetical protein
VFSPLRLFEHRLCLLFKKIRIPSKFIPSSSVGTLSSMLLSSCRSTHRGGLRPPHSCGKDSDESVQTFRSRHGIAGGQRGVGGRRWCRGKCKVGCLDFGAQAGGGEVRNRLLGLSLHSCLATLALLLCRSYQLWCADGVADRPWQTSLFSKEDVSSPLMPPDHAMSAQVSVTFNFNSIASLLPTIP